MATTTLAINSNRQRNNTFLRAAVATVAVDAEVVERFVLPTGFGQCLVESVQALVSSLSGAYVAPAPAFDGAQFTILGSDATAIVDFFGASRFVNAGTTSARPTLAVYIDLNRRVLIRQQDIIQVNMPIIAGAGVTAVISCYIRGERIMTA